MKKTVLLICVFLMLILTACNGNYSKMNLSAPISIPENGIIEKNMLDKVKNDNAVATFVGNSGGIEYKWIVFGRDITTTKDVNFAVKIKVIDQGVSLKFSETENFGFTALLSIYLNEKWNVNNATAYTDGNVYGNVSITGSEKSVLNISINNAVEECKIIPNVVWSEDSERSEYPSNSENSSVLSSDTLSDSYNETLEISNSSDESENEVLNSSNALIFEDEFPNFSEESDYESFNSNDVAEDLKNDFLDSSNENVSFDDNSQSFEEVENSSESTSIHRPVSDGKDKEKDKYNTDPVPSGKPLPVEPEDQEINQEKAYTCMFSIECSTILNNLSDLDTDKLELVPSNGVILALTKVTFYEGESVFDVLKRVCKEYNIHLEFSWTPIYNSAYIEGIHNLYEFDCGSLSGWMYRVNGWYPNYGCSRYQLSDGEVVEWRYTCDLGRDVGEDRLGQL